MARHSTAVAVPELEALPVFLERHWHVLLAGRQVTARLDQVEDPASRFESFDELGESGFASVRRYAMRLRDGSRIRADVDARAGRVRFLRERWDPTASVGGFLRHALRESAVARSAAICVAAFRLAR